MEPGLAINGRLSTASVGNPRSVISARGRLGARVQAQRSRPSKLVMRVHSRHPLQNIAPSQLTFAVPKSFEHRDDKNNQAGHLSFMIISARCTEVPCQVALFGPEIRLC